MACCAGCTLWRGDALRLLVTMSQDHQAQTQGDHDLSHAPATKDPRAQFEHVHAAETHVGAGVLTRDHGWLV